MDKKLNDKVEVENFSLVLGGPLYQFYRFSHLVKPPLDLLRRRMIACSLLTWLPLLFLSMIGGTAFMGVNVPFFSDLDTHVRFLGALPLLIIAEPVMHRSLRLVVGQFVHCNIVTAEIRPAFERILQDNMRLSNSMRVEVFLILLVMTLGHWVWGEYSTLRVASWYASVVSSHLQLTLAGYWCAFVSLPIFQFMLLRWYFRIGVWYRFLWQVSRLPLHLNSLHPDRAGGIGFLAKSVFAFGPVLLAHTVLFAGIMANRIWHTGVKLTSFDLEIIGILVFLVILVFLPLTFFCMHLIRAKQIGSQHFGIIASRYVNEFRCKWLTNDDIANNKTLLGTPDIQSLADLSSSFSVEDEMRVMPFSRVNLIQLIILIALPFTPLMLTMIPLEEMIKRVLKGFL